MQKAATRMQYKQVETFIIAITHKLYILPTDHDRECLPALYKSSSVYIITVHAHMYTILHLD